MSDLNNTLVVIRERTLWELCDLAMQVLRDQFRPLICAAALTMIPAALFNYWFLSGNYLELNEEVNDYWFRLFCLGYYQIPLVTAPVTLLLGQAMFQRKLDYRRAARDLAASLPQLIGYQVVARFLFFPQGLLWGVADDIWRGWLMFLILLWIWPATRWAYLNEVILLERNPWWGGVGQLSTRQRNNALHTGDLGMIYGRVFALWMIEQQLIFLLLWGLWFVRGQFSTHLVIDASLHTVLLPIVFWFVALYLTVVRFLCYLDLRIRREGWEVDLALRAAAEQLLRVGGTIETHPTAAAPQPLPPQAPAGSTPPKFAPAG